jgi:hypothetical protein
VFPYGKLGFLTDNQRHPSGPGLGRVNNWALKNTLSKLFNLTLLTQKWLVIAIVFMLEP